ncbi:MAG: hypothetical protein PF450_05810, partial [Bacteroidales bacterium]|nr:hypothetical protein [Bacteroidales bacterium]
MMKKYEHYLLKQAEGLSDLTPIHKEGFVSWSSPSNIAFVKYWGKYPGQIPANASLSMTLSKSVTKTHIEYSFSENNAGLLLDFEFEGKQEVAFKSRILNYLNSLTPFLPWLQHTALKISTENTFPHSSGIASSASALSALAVGLCNIEEKIYDLPGKSDFHKKASFIARLGSGSASRSVYPQMAIWGSTTKWPESSNEFAIRVNEIHKNFIGMKDSILIIESGKKEVSSSLGHDLMKTNPYAKLRFEAAEENMQKLHKIFQTGDFGQFLDLIENEALSLHAMMMTSSPGYILMKPNTIEAIQRIRNYRKSSGKNVGFTLDAGANVHVLYPETEAVN